MRIPIPLVILLCLAVVGGVWWHGTRHSDYLRPPPESKLAKIRAKVGLSLPPADHPDDVVADPPPQPAEETIAPPPIKPPVEEPQPAIAITLHAGTGKSTAAILSPVLEEIAREIEHASAGALSVSASVASGNDIPSTIGPAPVALWIAGSAGNARSTEVLAFTVGTPETLRADVSKTLFQLVRGYLQRTASLIIPAPRLENESPEDLLQNHVPRAAWQELGSRLSHPPDE